MFFLQHNFAKLLSVQFLHRRLVLPKSHSLPLRFTNRISSFTRGHSYPFADYMFPFLLKLKMKLCWPLSCVRFFATPWTIAHQTPLSMGFSRQEYWSGLPYLPPGILPNPEIDPRSPAALVLQTDSLPLSHQGHPLKIWPRVKSSGNCAASPWQFHEQCQSGSLFIRTLPIPLAVLGGAGI